MDALAAGDLAEVVLGQAEVEEEPELGGQRVGLGILGLGLAENFDLLVVRCDSGTKSTNLMQRTHVGLFQNSLSKKSLI